MAFLVVTSHLWHGNIQRCQEMYELFPSKREFFIPKLPLQILPVFFAASKKFYDFVD